MATARAVSTPTSGPASGSPRRGPVAALRGRPALVKLLLLAVIAAVAVPVVHARWGGECGPRR